MLNIQTIPILKSGGASTPSRMLILAGGQYEQAAKTGCFDRTIETGLPNGFVAIVNTQLEALRD